jgi:hypothetical protein
MKRVILLSLLVFMAMVLSTNAFAQIETKIFGMIDAQWQYNVNASSNNTSAGIYDVLPATYKYGPPLVIDTDFGTGLSTVMLPFPNKMNSALDRKVNYYESRARLGFTAIMDKNLSGTIFFEMDADVWGGTPDSARNKMGYWAADRAAVEIKNVYIDFGLPYIGIPLPMNFRVGLQPLAIRPNLLLATDGMAINWSTKIDPVAIQLIYAKPFEGKTAVAQDDADVLGGVVSAKFGTLTGGAYALYYNMNQYPFPSAVLPYGYSGASTPASPANLVGAVAANDAQMWWYGVYLDGKLGPVDVNLDGIMDRGKVMPRDSFYGPTNFFLTDVKYRGWAARAKVDFPWEKFNFGLVAYYASGADAEDTHPSGLPNTVPPAGFQPFSKKVTSYVVPPGSEAGSNFGESVVFYSFSPTRGATGIANNINYTQMCRGPIGGTWMAKAYASVKAAPWYKVTFQGMYIGDTTKNADTFGNARELNFFFGSQPRDKKDIGWEFDIINEFQIYKNLKLTVAGGYMFAGKAMDQTTNLSFLGFPWNEEIKNPWAITWNLMYTF